MRPALLPLVASIALCTGCGDALYYQTRAAPEGGSEFGFVSWLFHSEDSDVYELPSRPPAISTATEDNHLARRDCERPIPRFKTNTLATIEDEDRRTANLRNGPIDLVTMEDPDLKPRGGGTQDVTTLAGWRDPEERGAREHLGVRPLANYERKPLSQKASGVDRNPKITLATMADRDDYCP